jgi:hypothetical protein
VKISDQIRRWWKPAKWADEYPEISDGEGFAAVDPKTHRPDRVGEPLLGKTVADPRH